ncbi:alanine acetyltransferase [Stenotrophomonas bentonitica]|uniref:alanine acetyltransferase n=1 Tax=Stenotrophomonas bentonitica TaxID=1450134 RepID=UPI00345E7736
MGHTVFVDGSIEAAPEPVVELGAIPAVEPGPARLNEAAPRPNAAPHRPAAPSAPPLRNAPVDEAPSAPTAPRTGTRRPAVRMPPPLQIALLRASGCNPNDPETQALMASWNLDELRGNAAAKRALWPQLRALRRRGTA